MKNNESLKDTQKMRDYTKRCMKDSAGKFKPAFEELWKQAGSLTQYKAMLKNDVRTRMERATALLFREDPFTAELFEYRYSQVGDNSFYTHSDAGSLKIGNDSYSILIPNGSGDGAMLCAIVESGKFNRDAFDYFCPVEGTFNIYGYDCGDDIVITESGRFGIYHGNGFVVLERWGNRK